LEQIILIKGAQLFAPTALGTKDLLLAGNTIAAIADNLMLNDTNLPITVIDGSGKLLVPGFVDSLVHYIGGGGEGEVLHAGVPSVVVACLMLTRSSSP
jgi:beta-aspartyl-dipeptidase (metallo-type)